VIATIQDVAAWIIVLYAGLVLLASIITWFAR